MTIKAVLFDMDGVLIEAKDWHYEALNRALDLFGMSISRVDHLTTFDGLPTRTKLQMLSKYRGLPVELHEFLNEMKQLYTMEIVATSCKPTFNHQMTLATLKKQGFMTAVCSNSVRASVHTMMEKSNLAQYMDLMLSNEDVTNGKPSPEIYLRAMELLGVLPSQCLVVEDNENGIKAAKESGAVVHIVSDVSQVTPTRIISAINDAGGLS